MEPVTPNEFYSLAFVSPPWPLHLASLPFNAGTKEMDSVKTVAHKRIEGGGHWHGHWPMAS